MSTPTLILGNNKWAIEEDSVLGYAVEDRNGSYLPREIPFTRASDATFTTSTGVIRQACWNLLGYSEEFDNAIWTKAASSITANSTTSPNGSTSADTITADGTTALHRLGVGSSITTGTTYTLSIYAKKNTNNFIQIVGGFDAFGSNVWANFDLNIGVVGSVGSSTTASIVNMGSGWYRCVVNGVSTATTTVLPYQIVLISSATSLRAETNNLSTSVFIWGAQLVQGSDALGYLRTTDRLNMPRVDSSTGTKTLLLEAQRTNTMLYSQAVNSWAVKTELTITDNNAISPDGTQDASYIQQTTGGNAVVFQSQSVSVTTGQAQTVSFYAKAKEVTSITLRLGTTALWSGGARPAFTCDLLTGSISVGTGTATVSSQNVGNGWYRFIVTTPATLTSGVSTLQTPTGTVFSSTSGDGFYLWGIQWEQNASYPTTYVPTAATTVTRVADTFTRSNIYTNGYIGRTSGTWFVELRNNLAYTRDASGTFYLDEQSGGLGNGFNIRNVGTPNQRFVIVKYVGFVSSNLYFTLTDTVKLAIKWNGATADVFVNGVKVVSGTSFTSTAMEFLGANGSDQPKYIEQMELYSAALDDAECISITTL